MAAEQSKDSWIKLINKKIQANSLKKNEKYVIDDNVLYKYAFDSNGVERKLICLPRHLRRDVLHAMHDDLTAAHQGFVRTLYRIKQRFYFPRMEKVVRRYVRSCKLCQARKPEIGKPKGELQNIVVNEPFEMVGLDILGEFPITRRKNRYIIVLIDYFTKYIETAAIRDKTANSIVDFFLRSVVLRHGCTKRVLTDQGRGFIAEFNNQVLEALSIKHIMSSVYHPSTNGLVERQNRTLQEAISLYVSQNQKDWDLILAFVTFAINTARSESTKFSPFNLIYGRDPKVPLDLIYKTPSNFIAVDDIESRFLESWSLVRQNLNDARRRQKDYYDSRHRKVSFEIGDKVLIYSRVRRVGLNPKLQPLWSGPFIVTKKFGTVTYQVNDPDTGYSEKAHVQRLRPYYDDDLEDSDIWDQRDDETLRTLSSEFSSRPEEILPSTPPEVRTESQDSDYTSPEDA